jgi:hypothetical protein
MSSAPMSQYHFFMPIPTRILAQLNPVDKSRVRTQDDFPFIVNLLQCRLVIGGSTMTGWDRSPGPDNDYASAQPTSSVWRGTLVMVLVLFAAGLVIGWLS